jgi:hypothetical protein
MLANLDDEQEQQQVQATPTPAEQGKEPDPGDQEFDQFEGEGNAKVEGFYGPLSAGDENAEGGSDDGKPAGAQTQQQGTDDGIPKTPIRILRYQGREVPLYTKEEEEGLLQKGMDYTAKTMALSPWRKRIEFLYQNPDKLQLIDRLMSGEQVQPETLAALGKTAEGENKGDAGKADVKPVQKDDETFEDFTERLSEWKARNIVKAELEVFQKQSAQREFQQAAVRDPLMPYVTQAINADLQSGMLPEAVFKAADDDPTAAAKLYGAYRTRIAAWIEAEKAKNPQQQQPNATTQTQQQPARQPSTVMAQPQQQRAATRQPAPFAETGRGARRAVSGRDLGKMEAQVIKDMSQTDFEALVERVKSGG